MLCSKCGDEYEIQDRRGKPGKVTECQDCAEEVAVKYTGVNVYDHKTSATIQINANPELTKYILAATKLQSNKFFWWSLGLDQMVHHLTHYIIIYLII